MKAFCMLPKRGVNYICGIILEKCSRKLYTAYDLSFHVHVKRKCYRYSKRIGFLIQKFFPRLNVRFNQQLTESKSFLEDHKKWTVEKSNKWIQLKITALTTIISNKWFIWLIDWVEKLNSNGLIDGLVVEGPSSR